VTDVDIEHLLDEARTIDCAIRLHHPAWAVTVAEHLAAELCTHAELIAAGWASYDQDVAALLVTEIRAMRSVVLSKADELRQGTAWPAADLYHRLENVIHDEACAVGDAAGDIDE
jgi:hypothetical protein